MFNTTHMIAKLILIPETSTLRHARTHTPHVLILIAANLDFLSDLKTGVEPTQMWMAWEG